MKQEDKYIDYLFESAREEDPQISFEETAEVFSAATSPTLLGLAKGWFLKNINLNFALFLSIGILGFMAFFLFSSSNNSAETINENQIVTNQTQESSSIKNMLPEAKEELAEILPKKTSDFKAPKKLKSSSTISNSKTSFEKFEKTQVSESPTLPSISSVLKLETLFKISLSPTIKNMEKEKTIPVYQSESIITEEAFSPWVVGQESEMPWKIKKLTKVPILNETELVLQQFMNTKYLEQIFEKEENGYFKPLKMLVHYSINENYFVHFKGDKIRLINEEISPDFNPNEPFIDLEKFKIRKTKAHFNFSYKDYQVQMQLRRVGEGWKRHKLKVKKNKEVKINMTF